MSPEDEVDGAIIDAPVDTEADAVGVTEPVPPETPTQVDGPAGPNVALLEVELLILGAPEPPVVAAEPEPPTVADVEVEADPGAVEDPPLEVEALTVAVPVAGEEVGTDVDADAEVVELAATGALGVDDDTLVATEPEGAVVVLVLTEAWAPTVAAPPVGVVTVTEVDTPIGSSARALDATRPRTQRRIAVPRAVRMSTSPGEPQSASYRLPFPPTSCPQTWAPAKCLRRRARKITSQPRMSTARAGPPSEPSSLSGRHRRR